MPESLFNKVAGLQMEFLAKIVNEFQSLIIFCKRFHIRSFTGFQVRLFIFHRSAPKLAGWSAVFVASIFDCMFCFASWCIFELLLII